MTPSQELREFSKKYKGAGDIHIRVVDSSIFHTTVEYFIYDVEESVTITYDSEIA